MERDVYTAEVLVVDDEPDLAELVRQRFRRRIRRGELRFHFAHDGYEALEALQHHPDLDLIMTDINMPRMDGLTLLQELAKVQDAERIFGAVVVTAYGDMVNIRTAMNRGAFDFLTKPIDLDDLEVTIDKAVGRVREQRQARHARATASRYLSDEVAEQLLADPEATRIGGERRRLSLLMGDLRGFSAFCEALPPERALEVLNVYLGTMADVVTEHGGTVCEFVGDGLLAMFGAPTWREDHAYRAVACAVAMQQAMPSVNAHIEALGLPDLEMGVAINTGDLVVGNIGSEKRAKYGVVGSPINLLGRIEAATVGGQVLAAATTVEAAGPDVRAREAAPLAAKGFAEPVALFEIEGIGEHRLPRRSTALSPLPAPLPVRFHVLAGKHVAGKAVEGEVVALAPSGACLRTAAALDLLADLKLHLSGVGDLYAKVLDREADGLVLRFTAVPDEARTRLDALLSTEAAGEGTAGAGWGRGASG
ncbi:MAG: adenylate/guanylate cyclase domain-containing protein [Rhodothermales bacterium]|nr:adenylate/guanylate cyclase domain-containing protein [Rhodothermales bacterium]